jgi:asparagine synthase (glutamine-hydrolysing)
MSGIAAILNLDGSPVARTEVERMANVLKPYGQDRQKIVMRGNAAFVFCLHQITPEDSFEQQPLVFANRFIMLFDGRIDNRHELSAFLNIPAADLPFTPDSTIAMRLFDRWGEHAFERILGAFAIIVMDLRDDHLICARDQMGLRVLHYHLSATRFAVATNPDTLFALSWIPRICDKDKIVDSLVNRGMNEETTYYKDILRILPGSIVSVRDSSLSKTRFWNADNIPDVRFKHDHEYVEAFEERLHAAVKARLRSRRAPCATITGGLDSSSISVIAADMLAARGDKLNTFTAVPEADFTREETRGLYFDERPYVLSIAELNGNITPHFVPPSKGPILEQIAEEIRVAGFPGAGTLNGLWVMDICAAARSLEHNVMLCGEIGNLTISYHGRGLFAELVRRGRLLRLFREIASSGFRWRHMIRHCTVAPFIPSAVFRIYKQWSRGANPPWHEFGAIQSEFATRSGIVERAAREYSPFDAPPSPDSRLDRINELHGFCDMADWYAALRAFLGIDMRTPAADQRVVEFCIGIPNDQFRRNGCERWLIKRTMRGRLPDPVLSNPKRGDQAADWFVRMSRERQQIAAEVKRLTGNPEVSSIIDLQRISEFLDRWLEREPLHFSPEHRLLRWIPQALGTANFIENVTGLNYGRRPNLGDGSDQAVAG